MAKILAIDYGNKRVGVAVTDDLQIIATRLTSLHSKDIISFLTNYIADNKVDAIVVGKPVNLKGLATDSSESVQNFVRHLKRKFKNISIVEIDERFTSKIASQTISKSGMNKKKRQNKELVDEISAVILLQDYLKLKENKFI
ncbi:MAG: Holliday junction resolvase RuvX [Crocinitomicaceae bacterium]|nr:Holliday junction resolvase RuvX [Crocinitomicaceae bacterium]|tara:strand:- start:4526 stop:4951 length:426 start_codon:yes stop_codon:yes gene_type:complete